MAAATVAVESRVSPSASRFVAARASSSSTAAGSRRRASCSLRRGAVLHRLAPDATAASPWMTAVPLSRNLAAPLLIRGRLTNTN